MSPSWDSWWFLVFLLPGCPRCVMTPPRSSRGSLTSNQAPPSDESEPYRGKDHSKPWTRVMVTPHRTLVPMRTKVLGTVVSVLKNSGGSGPSQVCDSGGYGLSSPG